MGIRSSWAGFRRVGVLSLSAAMWASAADAASVDVVTAIAAGGGESYSTYGHACAVVDGGLQCPDCARVGP